MIRRPPRSTLSSSSAASDVYKRQITDQLIQQRPRRLGRRLLRSFLSNYLQHGRTFPTGVGSPALLEEPDGTSGRYALRAPQPEISDPQVSSIPPSIAFGA